MILKGRLNPADKARLERMFNEIKKTSGREMKTVTRNAARDACRLARRFTPQAKKNAKRWIAARNPATGKFLFHKFIGRGQNVIISKNKFNTYQKDKRRKRFGMTFGTPTEKKGFRRGFAKAGWLACLAKLGVAFNPDGRTTPNLALGDVFLITTKNRVSYVLRNNVPFIAALDRGSYPGGTPAHIGQRTIQALLIKTEKNLQRSALRIRKRVVGF